MKFVTLFLAATFLCLGNALPAYAQVKCEIPPCEGTGKDPNAPPYPDECTKGNMSGAELDSCINAYCYLELHRNDAYCQYKEKNHLSKDHEKEKEGRRTGNTGGQGNAPGKRNTLTASQTAIEQKIKKLLEALNLQNLEKGKSKEKYDAYMQKRGYMLKHYSKGDIVEEVTRDPNLETDFFVKQLKDAKEAGAIPNSKDFSTTRRKQPDATTTVYE